MKCGARVALGVAGGYFLGRTKKMKLALMLGGMAAGRRAGGPGELLGQGTKLLRQSPELAALADQLRGRLVEAGKGAALAVAARQVESLTDRVGSRVEALGSAGPKRGRKARQEPDETDAPEDAALEDPPEDEEPEPTPRRPARRRNTASAGRNSSADSNSPAPKKRSSASAGNAKRSGTRGGTRTTGTSGRTRRPARTRGGGDDG